MTISPDATAIADVTSREARCILQVYRRMPVTFVRGQGVRLFDSDERESPETVVRSPLVITEAEADEALGPLDAALAVVGASD